MTIHSLSLSSKSTEEEKRDPRRFGFLLDYVYYEEQLKIFTSPWFRALLSSLLHTEWGVREVRTEFGKRSHVCMYARQEKTHSLLHCFRQLIRVEASAQEARKAGQVPALLGGPA
jgi:hypothetical protein